jgi:hypothetical protein
MPLYVGICFLFHPLIGIAAGCGALILVALTVMTEAVTRAEPRAAVGFAVTRYPARGQPPQRRRVRSQGVFGRINGQDIVATMNTAPTFAKGSPAPVTTALAEGSGGLLRNQARPRKRRTSSAKISGVSCGIQCEAFSTRTRRAFGISRVNLSPSRIVCQGSCTPHRHKVGAAIAP